MPVIAVRGRTTNGSSVGLWSKMTSVLVRRGSLGRQERTPWGEGDTGWSDAATAKGSGCPLLKWVSLGGTDKGVSLPKLQRDPGRAFPLDSGFHNGGKIRFLFEATQFLAFPYRSRREEIQGCCT